MAIESRYRYSLTERERERECVCERDTERKRMQNLCKLYTPVDQRVSIVGTLSFIVDHF